MDSFDSDEENFNVRRYEKQAERIQDKMILAEEIFEKLKNYIDFHNLNMLNSSPHICKENLINLL